MPHSPLSRPNVVMCRYNEIAIKGGNRHHFEHLLMDAIARALHAVKPMCFTRERGRILCHHPDFHPFSTADWSEIQAQMRSVFGLASFSPGMMVKSDWNEIFACIQATFPAEYQAVCAAHGGRGEKPMIRYRTRARRSWKAFPMRSLEMELRLADELSRAYPGLQIDLTKPDLSLGIEVRESWTFLFYHQVPGPGGLPTGSSATALALLSGGIDSPVACYLTMKRGCPLHFLTFHSHPYTPPESVLKVARLVKKLNHFQKPGRLLACNLAEAQKIIRDSCTERFRTVLYRRLMMRISCICAQQMKCVALVTGEAVGQVASQTVRNLNAINAVADRLVLRPLAGMDKQETIAIARQIDTLTISNEPCPDSCTVFAPRSPATSAPLARILKEEAKFDLAAMLQQCLAVTEAIAPSSGNAYPFEFDAACIQKFMDTES